jgi:hypothetical protein
LALCDAWDNFLGSAQPAAKAALIDDETISARGDSEVKLPVTGTTR